MDSYRTLYRIKVEHDYFDGKPCTALQCHLTPQGEALARRRGLLFRQTAENEWTVLFNREPDTGLDTLILALSIADTSFPLYTAWDDFRPSADYELELPQKTETLEAVTAIHASGRKRTIGSGFCTLHLRMTDEMLQVANAGTPMQTVLHFHAPKMRWEYLFIPRNSEKLSASKIRLEEVAGKIEFTAFKECEAYGRKAWYSRSKGEIPMRLSYTCRLRVTAQEEGKPKRVLLPQVPPPETGTYMDTPKGILRQVCYY